MQCDWKSREWSEFDCVALVILSLIELFMMVRVLWKRHKQLHNGLLEKVRDQSFRKNMGILHVIFLMVRWRNNTRADAQGNCYNFKSRKWQQLTCEYFLIKTTSTSLRVVVCIVVILISQLFTGNWKPTRYFYLNSDKKRYIFLNSWL